MAVYLQLPKVQKQNTPGHPGD